MRNTLQGMRDAGFGVADWQIGYWGWNHEDTKGTKAFLPPSAVSLGEYAEWGDWAGDCRLRVGRGKICADSIRAKKDEDDTDNVSD